MRHSTKMTAATAFLLAGIIASPASAQTNWDLASVFAPNSADGIAAAHFADLVREKTNGEIEITVHYSGALGYKCPDLMDVVSTGAVPVASICTSMLGGHNPIFLVSTLPFVMERATHARVFRDTYIVALNEAYMERNQVVLYSYPNTPAGLWSDEERLTPDSLANWKMRSFDGNSLTTMTNAGAAAINLPWTDVVPALSTGTINGVVTASDAGFASGFNDYLPYFIAVNAFIGIADATINLDTLNSLTPEQRAAVIEAGEETTQFAFDRMEALVSETYDNMREAGMTVVENPPAELMAHLQHAGSPVVEAWLEQTGATGESILHVYRARLSALE